MAAPLRFGLIGYGLWGRHHAAAIAAAPGAALAGIACASAATAAAARRDFPSTPVTVDYRELLARPDLDAVAVVVPNHLHAEVGVAALEAGKDVLLEKPMATSLADCDRLLAAAWTSGRVLTIGHELRHSAQYGRVKAMIDAGEIGTPTYAAFSLFRFPFRPGSYGWRYDAARVGSWILEEPVHFFDFMMWYFDRVGDPLSIRAVGDAGARGAGLSDHFTALLRFPGPAHAVITQTKKHGSASWSASRRSDRCARGARSSSSSDRRGRGDAAHASSRGSRTSRSPSPTRFMASTVSRMPRPGNVEIHQASRR